MSRATNSSGLGGRRGFTLVEAVMAALVVGVIFAGALHAVGASGADRVRAAQKAAGALLADGLASEIMARKYSAASSGSGGSGGTITIGIGGLGVVIGGGGLVDIDTGGESPSSPLRSPYASVDDYSGLVDSPPTDVDGAEIAGFGGWSREVKVELVNPADGVTVSATDQGLKRVTVTVKRGTGVVETRAFLVSNVP